MFRPRIEFVLQGLAGDHAARCLNGGKSSSSSASTSNTSAIDKRMVFDTGQGISADYSTVQILDAGITSAAANALNVMGANNLNALNVMGANNLYTINAATEIGLDAMNKSGGMSLETTKAALDSVNRSGSNALVAMKDALSFSSDTFNGNLGLASTLFSGALQAVTGAQQNLGQAYQLARETETNRGTIDNKTIVIVALAAAGVAAIAFTEHRR